jgi:hypothetical protein
MLVPSLKNRVWTLITAATTVGIVAGFAVPLAASYQHQKFYQPTKSQLPAETVIIPTLAPTVVVVPEDPNSAMARLADRNRRLEALVATLRKEAKGAVQHPNE